MDSASEPTLPVILVGDLNLTPWSPHLATFEQASHLRRAVTGWNLTPTWYRFPAFPFGLVLDHALISEHLICNRHQVGSDMGSLIIDQWWSSYLVFINKCFMQRPRLSQITLLVLLFPIGWLWYWTSLFDNLEQGPASSLAPILNHDASEMIFGIEHFENFLLRTKRTAAYERVLNLDSGSISTRKLPEAELAIFPIRNKAAPSSM